MKKIYAFVSFLLLLSFHATAQQPEVRISSDETKIKDRCAFEFTLFGANKDHLYAFNSNVSLLGNDWSNGYLTLFEVDKEGNVTAQKEFESLGRKTKVRKAFLNGDSIHLLINSNFRNDKGNKVLHVRLSIDDLRSTQTISYLQTDEMEENLFFSSPDTSWIGGFREMEDGHYQITMYDRNFEKVYSKQVILQNIQSIFVTNEAEIVLLGIPDGGNGIYFQIINEEQEQSFTADMDLSNIASIRIANFRNGRIYAGGLTGHREKNTRFYEGAHSLMYDTQTGELKTDRMSFTERDIAILNNKAIPKKKAEKLSWIDNLPMADAILSSGNNTVFAYHYVPSVLREKDFFQGGLFLFSIDKDGQIGWKHFIRRENNMVNELGMIQFLFEYKGEACIVYCAALKTALAETEEATSDVLKLPIKLSKSATVMAMMHADGSLTKILLDGQNNGLPYSTIEDQGERSFMMNRFSKYFIFIK